MEDLIQILLVSVCNTASSSGQMGTYSDLSTITDYSFGSAGSITFQQCLYPGSDQFRWYLVARIFNQTGSMISNMTGLDQWCRLYYTPDDVPSTSPPQQPQSGGSTATLNWTSATCYDEYLIVAAEGGSVGAGSPSGDGTAYTADADFFRKRLSVAGRKGGL